jgi:hypothetical protein
MKKKLLRSRLYPVKFALSVGEKQSDIGITPMTVIRLYIRLWITLMLFQPPLSHTSREPDAQSPTVLIYSLDS